MIESQQESKNPDFRVSERWRFLYETLCRRGKTSLESGYFIFDKYTQLYSLAAAIGFTQNRRVQFTTNYTPFTLNEIERDPEWPALRAIAWKASNCELTMLLDKKATIRICDEFAEGGMEYLYEDFFSEHVKDNHLHRASEIGIENELSLILKGIKEEASNCIL